MRLNSSNKKRFCLFGAICLLWAVMPALVPQPLNASDTPLVVVDEAEATKGQVTRPADGSQPAATDPNSPSIVLGGESLKVDTQTAKQKLMPKVRSLFFNERDMESIRKAVAAYTRASSGEGGSEAMDFLRRLQGEEKPKPGQRYFMYPQFFLSSLVYHSSQDWSARINGQYYTNKQPEGVGIRVTDIDKDKVALEWTPADLHRVEEVWNATTTKDPAVNLSGGKVTFTLKTNQTFSSYVMRVLEGKVKPKVLDLAPKTKDGKDLPADGKSTSSKQGATGQKDFLDELMGVAKGR